MRLSRLNKNTPLVRSVSTAVVENLELRQMLTAVLASDGILDVVGTPVDDKLTVTKVVVDDVAKLKVYENGNGDKTVSWFTLADVKGIRVDGLSGDDQITLESSKDGLIEIPATLIGGEGNDSLKGASGNDRLIGGPGFDYLHGGAGDDALFGNAGIDYLFPGAGANSIYSGPGADRVMSISNQDLFPAGKGKDTFEESAENKFTLWDYTDAPDGLTPQQVRSAYFMGDLQHGTSLPLKGKGQAIAIVDAYHTPTARRDLAKFCSTFGLSMLDTKTFKQIHPPGKAPIVDEGWAGEALLDIQWAHAMAPEATIILVEAKSAYHADLYKAVDYASDYLNKYYGGGVVSMSFGIDEADADGNPKSYITMFEGVFADSQNSRITYCASSGDAGGVVSYPSSSPNVLSIGGTSLYVDAYGNRVSGSGISYDATTGAPTGAGTGAPGGEEAWTDAGAGPSVIFPTPDYQLNLGLASDGRYTSDISMVADPATGASVYDSTSYTGWATVGGTSLSCPLFAGVVALINQQRKINKLGKIGNQLTERLYGLAAQRSGKFFFNDVDSGSSGNYASDVGYDPGTGLGTPKVNALVDALGKNKLAQNPAFLTTRRSTFAASVTVNSDITDAASSDTISDTSPHGGGLTAASIGRFTFKGITLTTGNYVMQMNPLHMIKSDASDKESFLDIYGVSPDDGSATPSEYDATTGSLTTKGTPILLYRNGSTVSGAAYYQATIVDADGNSTSYGGAIKFVGKISGGKIKGEWNNIYPALTFNDKGQLIGGQKIVKLYDTNGGRIVRITVS